jgi:NTP pyrophosphatase (non-canonical NTP hydrolase)
MNTDFCDKHGYELSSKENIMRMMIKLGEEQGELCEAVLASFGMQSKRKLDAYSIEDVKGELADVIVSAMVIAIDMDIDIEEILVDKVRSLDARIQA